jgi:predicted TIM-barrel fold metal-dependent hydrolase
LKIIDAQVHIWSSGSPIMPHRQVEAFGADEALAEMAAAGVDAAILHPPGWDPNSNQVSIEAVKAHPGKFAILGGGFDLSDPNNSSVVRSWLSQPGMAGLRFAMLKPEQRNWIHDGTIAWLWPVAETAGVPFATMAGRFLPEFAKIAERYPQLNLIVDHLGLVRHATDENAIANIKDLLALSRFPNVSVKATGAPAYSSQPYPFPNLHDTLHRIFDVFGPHRFFWGTDFTRMPCTYRQCVTLFTEELPWLKGSDLKLVMGKAICDLLKINLADD